MGMPQDERQFDPARPVVAFDFDGTLTIRDSFMAFLAFRTSRLGYAVGLVRLLPATLAYLVRRDRGALKQAATRVFLKGLTAEELGRSAEDFASQWVTRLLRPDAARSWLDWKTRGAVMAIVTASPEPIVAPFAERLGADVLIGTRLALDDAGGITGAFSTENCRAQAKVDRLRARFGPDVRLAAAYGDTSGDHEMIALAEHQGYRVFTGKP